MIADSILSNPGMRLTEFRASRDRLEEDGMRKMAEVFEKQKSIVKLELYQNGSKRALAPLLKALVTCKGTLKELLIHDQKSGNRAPVELAELITTCMNLEVLDISDLCLRTANCTIICTAIIKALNSGSMLTRLAWNYDLERSPTTARQFLARLSSANLSNLKAFELEGVVQGRSERAQHVSKFKQKGVTLTLWRPACSDDEGDESLSDGASSSGGESAHSSQEEDG
jgi:Ran GTPase-activating protein (RanGAP) involved in mRNA processing and transport